MDNWNTKASMSISSFAPTLAGFSAQRDSSFAVAGLDGVTLELFEALPLDAQAPHERRFSLMFRGPVQPMLEQATYTLEHPVLGALAIFLVPIGRNAQGVQYQALFN